MVRATLGDLILKIMAIYSVIVEEPKYLEKLGSGDLLFLPDYGGTSTFLQKSDKEKKRLIKKGEITHYTRSWSKKGEEVVVSSGEHEVQKGDFLVIANTGSSGQNATFVANFVPTDYAFITPLITDTFASCARHYMDQRPETDQHPEAVALIDYRTLETILEAILYARDITTPINDVIIVTHSNAGGVLYFGLTTSGTNARIEYDELDEYISDDKRPQITNRSIRDDATIHIRGCNIGQAEPFLELIQQIFGGSVSVTAPKYLDYFGENPAVAPDYHYEIMFYPFTVHCKEQVKDKESLIELFKDAKFKDVSEHLIATSKWSSWIPENIHPGRPVKSRHDCDIPDGIPDNPPLEIDREFRYKYQNIIIEDEIEVETDPGSSQIIDRRMELLRDELENRDEKMQDFWFPAPVYKERGYGSVDEFVDALSWTFVWDENEHSLTCDGSGGSHGGYTYKIRNLDSEPDSSDEIDPRVEIMREYLEGQPDMQESHPFPKYRQYGYDNLDEFVDNLRWNFRWSKGKLKFSAYRYVYEVRIPITDEENILYINACYPGSSKKYIRQDIVETDDKFFGIIAATATMGSKTLGVGRKVARPV